MARLDTHRDSAWNGDQGSDAFETRDWLEALHDVRRLSGNGARSRVASRAADSRPASGAACCRSPRARRTSTPSRRSASRHIPVTKRSRERFAASSAGTPWPWWSPRIARRMALGGHISTYASAVTLYEVGFNHFFRGPNHPDGADIIYFQGHAAPGIYARAYVEGRLTDARIHDFRRELAPSGGRLVVPRIRGSCLTSGSFPPCRWDWAR